MSVEEVRCVQGISNICRRMGIGCADVGGKFEMCADEMPPRAWDKGCLRTCQ